MSLNNSEYVTRNFVNYMSFEMHPHSALSLAKYKYHPPMVWLLPQLATKMRNINFEIGVAETLALRSRSKRFK